jgi:Uncharacterized protein conserved in bacteria
MECTETAGSDLASDDRCHERASGIWNQLAAHSHAARYFNRPNRGATNVGARFWEALENNDLSRWPNGIYARAYVRGYAKVVGVDPESTVDEFCRCFPQGDRRAEFVIRGQAEIVGHKDLQWRDRVPPIAGEIDRRGAGGGLGVDR